MSINIALLGAGRILEEPGTFVAWGTSMDQPGFSVTKPFDGNAAAPGICARHGIGGIKPP